MDALYRDYILDHYKNPRNFGTLDPHDLEDHDHNPLCGDEMGVHIVRARTARSPTCASTARAARSRRRRRRSPREELIGMEVDEIGDLDAEWIIDLLGIDISPTRRKCALLSLKVMRGATTGDASWPE